MLSCVALAAALAVDRVVAALAADRAVALNADAIVVALVGALLRRSCHGPCCCCSFSNVLLTSRNDFD